MTKKQFAGQIVFHSVLLLIFSAMFAVGSFFDEYIAAAIYSPGNVAATFVTTIGIYPFFASGVLFTGALCERVLHSGLNKPVRFLCCGLCSALALYSGFSGSKSLMSVDCLGGIYPSLNRNMPVIIIVSAVVAYPLFFLGYRLAVRSDDKLLTRKIICLIVTMLIATIFMESVKSMFSRPRYRIAVRGYDGIGFVPWYTPFQGANEYVAALGLEKTDFRSFPSGHSILSVSCIYIFMSLIWLFPKLQGKQNFLCICGLMFGIIVMFTRMLLGAHYLSDVSAGAAVGTLMSFIYTSVQYRIAVKYDDTSAAAGQT